MAENDDPDLELDPSRDPEEPDDQPDEPEDQPEPESQEDETALRVQDRPEDRQPERQPSRRDRRIETLTTALSEQRQRNDDLSRRLDTFLAGQHRVSQGETPEQRAQRLSLMTPEERLTETFREERDSHRRDMQQLQFAVVDGNDKAAFEAKCTVEPRYAKLKPAVEAKLTELRRNGQTAPREEILKWVLGDRVVQAWSNPQTTQRERGDAQRRVNAQRTRPANSGSDVSTGRRSQSNSLERRLENASI